MITEDRLRHILGVARRCESLAKDAGMSREDCENMFLLGFLHDVGYEYSDNVGHADKGAELLSSCNFPFVEDVRMHGKPFPVSDQSAALRILNVADIETSAKGERITASERLSDVAARYGKDSVQYADMKYLCEQLNLI